MRPGPYLVLAALVAAVSTAASAAAQVAAGRLQSYIEVLQAYRRGEVEKAFGAVETAPPSDLEQSVGRLADTVQRGQADARLAELGAVLHIELALGEAEWKTMAVHLGLAERLAAAPPSRRSPRVAEADLGIRARASRARRSRDWCRRAER
jgi:hypothetical protein